MTNHDDDANNDTNGGVGSIGERPQVEGNVGQHNDFEPHTPFIAGQEQDFNWEIDLANSDLKLELPKLPDPAEAGRGGCESACAENNKKRQEGCDHVRKRIELYLKQHGCESACRSSVAENAGDCSNPAGDVCRVPVCRKRGADEITCDLDDITAMQVDSKDQQRCSGLRQEKRLAWLKQLLNLENQKTTFLCRDDRRKEQRLKCLNRARVGCQPEAKEASCSQVQQVQTCSEIDPDDF